jgi:hypothetical protein
LEKQFPNAGGVLGWVESKPRSDKDIERFRRAYSGTSTTTLIFEPMESLPVPSGKMQMF